MPPTIDIDMFDDAPKVGDNVKVLGKVESINEDTGEVDVSYDDVKIVNDRKKSKNTQNDNYVENTPPDEQGMPQSQSLDQALAQAFPRTE